MKTWSDLEVLVESLYLDSGATLVDRDRLICGHQIDVYVEQIVMGAPLRILIACKNYSKPVGINDVSDDLNAIRDVLNSREADVALFISPSGFTRKAKLALQGARVRFTTLKMLEAELLSYRSYLELVGADIKAKDVFSEGWFIEPRVDDPSGKGTASLSSIRDWAESPSNLLLVLGSFGSGKTTLLQKFFLEKSIDCYSKSMSAETLVPVFIRLRDHNESSSLSSLLTDALINHGGLRLGSFKAIQSAISTGRILLLLDGLDEMSIHPDRAQLRRNLIQIAEIARGAAKIVLSSRPSVFRSTVPEDELRDLLAGQTSSQIESVSLAPFTVDQVKQYIELRCPESSADVYSSIETTYNLLDLASRPFLLELLIQELPTLLNEGVQISRARIYESSVRRWLDRDQWRVLQDDQLRVFLMEELASMILAEGLSSISSAQIEQFVRTQFEANRFFGPEDIRNIEADVHVCSFLVRSDSNEYVFSHRSFAEYFLARKICRNMADPSRHSGIAALGQRGAISEVVEEFVLDLAFTLFGFPLTTVLAFSAPKFSQEFLLDEEQEIRSNYATELRKAAIHLVLHEDAVPQLRGLLLFATLAAYGKPDDMSDHLLALHKSASGSGLTRRTARIAKLVLNQAYLVGNPRVGEAIINWCEREVLPKAKKWFSEDYLPQVRAYTEGALIPGSFAGTFSEPDEALMREFEQRLDIPRSRTDDFRRYLLELVGAATVEGRAISLDLHRSLRRGCFLAMVGFDPGDIWWSSGGS